MFEPQIVFCSMLVPGSFLLVVSDMILDVWGSEETFAVSRSVANKFFDRCWASVGFPVNLSCYVSALRLILMTFAASGDNLTFDNLSWLPREVNAKIAWSRKKMQHRTCRNNRIRKDWHGKLYKKGT